MNKYIFYLKQFPFHKFLFLFLIIFSILSILISCQVPSIHNKVLVNIILFWIIIIIFSFIIDYTLFLKFADLFLIFSIALSLLSTFNGIQTNHYRWLSIPVLNLDISPIVFLKFSLIFYIIKCTDKLKSEVISFKQFYTTYGIPILISLMVGLIVDLSQTLIMFILLLGLLWIYKQKLKYILSLLILPLIYIIVFILLNDHYLHRVVSLIFTSINSHIGDNYQINQAYETFKNIGFLGIGFENKGLASSIPVYLSDFVFVYVAEDVGLLGILFIILLYIILIVKAIYLSCRIINFQAFLIIIGLSYFQICQLIVHLLVTTGLIPVFSTYMPYVSPTRSSFLLYDGIVSAILINLSMKSNTL